MMKNSPVGRGMGIFPIFPIIVIYDGECRLCRSSLEWLQQKMCVTALPFQSTDLNSYGLTSEQCSAEVFALCDDRTYSGSAAIAFLLNKRGNTFLSWLIVRSGRVGRFGYRWIASHRNSLAVRILTNILDRYNTKYKLSNDTIKP